MLLDIHPKEIEQLILTPIVQQTAFWSAVKKELGTSSIAIHFKSRKSSLFTNITEDEYIDSDLLVIIQQIDANHSVAYVPYGPELEPEDAFQGLFLEELSESIRPFLPNDCILIRYDLLWESYWAKDKTNYDEHGIWIGTPNIFAQEFRFNFTTMQRNFKKSMHNILPSNTIYLNLATNHATILNRMKPKTRYNIGLAHRKGVTVKTVGIESIDIWYALYQETAMRNNINLNDIHYFKAVLSEKEIDFEAPTEVLLLVAELDGQPLASMFLIISGHRSSYLYGASSSEHRNAMGAYALQWEAIRLSKSKGCTEYDMFGVAPNPDPAHPLHGLYKFKIGFGGDMYHSLGCWDYPLDQSAYQIFKVSEMNCTGYHLA